MSRLRVFSRAYFSLSVSYFNARCMHCFGAGPRKGPHVAFLADGHMLYFLYTTNTRLPQTRASPSPSLLASSGPAKQAARLVTVNHELVWHDDLLADKELFDRLSVVPLQLKDIPIFFILGYVSVALKVFAQRFTDFLQIQIII